MISKILVVVITTFFALHACLGLAAPMPAPTCFTPKKFDSRMTGNWEIAESSVRYSIRAKGKQVCLYGREVQGNEWFEVSDLKWDGKVLSATFLMPSTKWRTSSRLTLVDANKIRDDYTNKDGKQTDFWTRRQ
jgi:hypothetical protein